ncbi:protein artichoke-like [Argiope bruennichi]|uniref:protein artichoke-like n=1 Tax=Argiope bruennichi TaxID=94029 RepID=UPI002494DF9D|nr:protein artichoke-like [Argiope bruennichi]
MTTKTCTVLLLFLGLILPALSDKCPDPDRLPSTCQCEEDFVEDDVDVEISCSGSSIQELRDALRLMDKNSRLEVQLDDMILGTLPADIFNGWNVVKLDISHCELDTLKSQGRLDLQGLEDKLEVLVITASLSEENGPNEIIVNHFRRLRELDLSFNAIEEIHDNWFSVAPPSLTHLTLSNNGIVKLGDRAFENLNNLEFLGLHGNRFGPIKRSMLPKYAIRLEELEFDNNDFTSVPDDLFTSMPALKELSLRTNRITHLQEQAFKPIWEQLGVFDVRGNPLECDSTTEWMFRAKTDAYILGRCEGPRGREGMDLKDFIRNRGQ